MVSPLNNSFGALGNVKAQRHKFDGETCGPPPSEKKAAPKKKKKSGKSGKPKGKFTREQLRAGQGILTLQTGTNEFASQKGMTAMGAVRHVRDIKADDMDKDGQTMLTQQAATHKYASQKGMTAMGACRHVCDIPVTQLWDDVEDDEEEEDEYE